MNLWQIIVDHPFLTIFVLVCIANVACDCYEAFASKEGEN